MKDAHTLKWNMDYVGMKPEHQTMLQSLLNEPHRKYHNQDHIERLFQLAYEEGTVTKDMVKTILYHDAVYYPCSMYNEELSVALADNHIDWGNFGPVEKAILMTKDHCDPDNEMYADWMLNFLDYDLEGLANNFFSNTCKLWFEFIPFYPEYEIVAGRTKFFEKMLNQTQIFWKHPEWEEKARKNMADELRFLRALTATEYSYRMCENHASAWVS